MLSAIVIAKNNADVISDCLASLNFCDEIILVDAGSTDETVAIAKKFKSKIVEGEKLNFAKQRNIGKHAAKGDWILYIDTDERVSKPLQDEIVDRVTTATLSAFRLQRQNYYLGNHAWPKIEKLERLFKKSDLIEWYGELHETAKVKGEVGDLKGLIYHYTHRDLFSMLQKTILWSDIEAKLRIGSNHPSMSWWRFFRVMLTAFYDSYITQRGYKVGTAGLVESMYQAFSIFVTYAKLWELQEKHT